MVLAGLFCLIESLLIFVPLVTHPIVMYGRRQFEPVFVAVLMVMCVYMRGPGDSFIYFQF